MACYLVYCDRIGAQRQDAKLVSFDLRRVSFGEFAFCRHDPSFQSARENDIRMSSRARNVGKAKTIILTRNKLHCLLVHSRESFMICMLLRGTLENRTYLTTCMWLDERLLYSSLQNVQLFLECDFAYCRTRCQK